MTRPTSKTELLALSQQKFEKLFEFINGLSPEEKEKIFIPGLMNRNIRDVLAHLHQWHLMLLIWFNTGVQGKKPSLPAEGYTWKMTPQLNKKIWEDWRSTPLEVVIKCLYQSHHEVMVLIKSHSQDQLFQKNVFGWTGSTTLGAYCISSTSSHYDWAFKLIRKGLQQ